jgi:hypothetical protein
MLRVVTLPSVPSCLPSVGHGLWGVFPVLVLVVGMVMTALLSRVLIVALLLMMMRMMI